MLTNRRSRSNLTPKPRGPDSRVSRTAIHCRGRPPIDGAASHSRRLKHPRGAPLAADGDGRAVHRSHAMTRYVNDDITPPGMSSRSGRTPAGTRSDPGEPSTGRARDVSPFGVQSAGATTGRFGRGGPCARPEAGSKILFQNKSLSRSLIRMKREGD